MGSINMERIINYIYDCLFRSRSREDEENFGAKIMGLKIKKMEKESISDLDDPVEKRYYKKLLWQVGDLLNIKSFKNVKIMEMGSGPGLLSLHMAQAGAKVVLLDSSKTALDYSLMMYEKIKNERGAGDWEASFVCHDIFGESFPSDEFDIIHNYGVIEHYNFSKAQEIIGIMKKNVKAGGYVIVAVPNYFCPNLIFTWAKYRKGTERFYSKDKLKKMMEKSGLRSVKIETSTFVYPDWIPQFIIQKTQRFENFLGKNLNLGFLYIGVGKV